MSPAHVPGTGELVQNKTDEGLSVGSRWGWTDQKGNKIFENYSTFYNNKEQKYCNKA